MVHLRLCRSLSLATLLAAAALAPAQDDPFAVGGTTTDDPFAVGGEAPAASPTDNPFGEPAAPADLPEDNPFADTAAPTVPTGDNPFASPDTTAPAPTAENPFGEEEEPFAAGEATGFTEENPFGEDLTTAPAMDSEPIDGMGTEIEDFDNPFAAPGDASGSMAGGSLFDSEVNPFEGASAVGEAGAENLGGIEQLYSFRYIRDLLWNGTEIVVRERMTETEAATFDEEGIETFREKMRSGEIAAQGVVDQDAYARWLYYYDQLEMWGDYVEAVALAGQGSEDALSKVQWPGTAQAAAGAPGGAVGGVNPELGFGAEAVVAANQGQTLDQQVGGFSPIPTENPFAGFADQAQQQAGYPASTIQDQVVDLYNSLLGDLRGMEQDQEQFMREYLERLQEREVARAAYWEYLNNQELAVEDAVLDWNRRYNGDVQMIGGVRYELYQPGTVPNRIPRNTNVVITDYRLTPYDILDDEGQLREAARQ